MTLKELISNPDSIKELVKPMGYCIVSCKITDEELPVGYMYREAPFEDEDCGWRFLSGTEDEEYLDIDENNKLVDVNVVANLDPAIIPHLYKKKGTELERDFESNTFVELKD